MDTLELARIVGGRHKGNPASFRGFNIDSRQVEKGQLFVALRGRVHDGHDFAREAVKRGAAGLLCERELPVDVPQVVVEDSLQALRRFALWKRENFRGKVVAITGSAGKTTTKEMAAFLLSKVGKVCKTPKNFNSQVGVPLSLANFDKDCDYWVVELGASQRGDVKRLVEVVKPHVRAITAIGEEHLETFGCLDDVVLGNGEVFLDMEEDHAGVLPSYVSHCYQLKNRVIFGEEPLKAKDIRLSVEGVSFSVEGEGFFIPVPSLAVVENALCVFGILQALKLDWKSLGKELSKFNPVEGRFRVIKREGLVLIDDTYNANPPSVRKALETLSLLEGYKIAVLGDMLELGENSAHYHREVGRLCAELGIDLCLFYGDMMRYAYEECKRHSSNAWHFNSREELLDFLKAHMPEKAVMLFKGSRGMRMEELLGGLYLEASGTL